MDQMDGREILQLRFQAELSGTTDICNTPENLSMFQFVRRRRSKEQKIGL